MAEQNAGQYPHIRLAKKGKAEPYRNPRGNGRKIKYPKLDRAAHGKELQAQIGRVRLRMDEAVELQQAAGNRGGLGLQLEFKSQPDVRLAFESLSREKQRIELLNTRQAPDGTNWATVFVPDGQLKVFEKLVTAYLTKGTAEKPKNAPLLNTIQEIRAATFEALWTDTPETLPQDANEVIWWEFWLPARENPTAALQRFLTTTKLLGFRTSRQILTFPERTILGVQASRKAISDSLDLLNEVAEIRRPKESANFFDSMDPQEQREWVEELLQRTTPPAADSPRICLIDTGVNAGHPLLSQHLDPASLHAIDPEWGAHDEFGHGTGLAGIALYGDLIYPLASSGPVPLSHRLESVKLLRNGNGNEGEHFGSLTMLAVGRPEVTHPNTTRVFSMAVTSVDDRDKGRPSAWSAAVDSLAADTLGDRRYPRLFVLSAGNADEDKYGDYPTSNQADSIHDPGQSWNALCIGAYTQKVKVTDYEAVAPEGGLSPFSTTSHEWRGSPWPIKPDVVFEGGNLARNTQWTCTHPDLMLLTTSHEPEKRLFATTWATSAASALASRMAAQIYSAYPHYWPETVRALMVNSAEWTPRMIQDFRPDETKGSYERLVRTCGFGVPSLDRAIWSASNSLTLIVEDDLQPYKKQGKKPPSAHDMNLHMLPWPIEDLLNLGNTEVEMRVTLSYFIEPNPGVMEKGITGRYRYESHGLRFDVSRPGEDQAQFRYRVNKTAREEEDANYQGTVADPGWLVGDARHHGSLHSDVWRGSAANLASLGMIAVSPASGWWKTITKQGKYHNRARYSLVVSITTQQTDVDLYAAVQTKIAAETAITT
ncbi:TPA: S8 family peptidase [Staphylococcus aureus]|uniref:S8 family peptidase n=1 Tax=Pseudomonas aeruginosa TaxID=287 RepID=UPI00295E5929|nr:S8 family peptidase [Pseudomonas aeruginosa]MEC6861779.1 S8 family peptidase [Pseudomonas aeruginosa]HDK9341716.1 S8 family peptidase [Staphylococcus aureus]